MPGIWLHTPERWWTAESWAEEIWFRGWFVDWEAYSGGKHRPSRDNLPTPSAGNTASVQCEWWAVCCGQCLWWCIHTVVCDASVDWHIVSCCWYTKWLMRGNQLTYWWCCGRQWRQRCHMIRQRRGSLLMVFLAIKTTLTAGSVQCPTKSTFCLSSSSTAVTMLVLWCHLVLVECCSNNLNYPGKLHCTQSCF